MANNLTTVLDVLEITPEQIREENREYNPSEWDKKIDRMLAYKGIRFFKAAPQRGYDYVRYYAVYQIEEGIILVNPVSYSSCLSNNGFCRIILAKQPEGYTFVKSLLKDGNGNYGYCANDKANRKIMASNSINFGAIFSNDF